MSAALRPRGDRDGRIWNWFLIVPTAWLTLFYLVPLTILIALSFGRTDLLGNPQYALNLENYQALASSLYGNLILRTLLFALVAVALCAVIGYPVAYAVAIYGGRYKNLLIALIALPLFVNYLVRIYAWNTILSDDGLLPSILGAIGLPAPQLMNTPTAVIGGLVYGYIIFMILPIYVAIERMDKSTMEAGRDLYGSAFATFRHVTFPATRKGIVNGGLLVFLPTMGDFISSQLLGGPNGSMIGNVIASQFTTGLNWPLGSALTSVLLVLLVLLVFVYLRLNRRAGFSVM